MKKLAKNLLIAALIMGFNYSYGQIELPLPSPGSKVTQKLGLTDIEVNYFRPKKKGREIFGSGDNALVPYGQKWRTGANQGTTISFNKDINFGGQDVKAGEYLVLTVPGADSWQVMLYSDVSMGGNLGAFKEENVVATATGTVVGLSNTVETLTMNISDISEDNTSANLEISWDKTAVKVALKTDFDAEVMASIEENTKVSPGNYLAAANYYFATDKDMDKALEWINMYLAVNPNQFWNVHLKAQILAKKGDKKAAIETAEQSKKMASEWPNGDFGFIKRNDDLISSLK